MFIKVCLFSGFSFDLNNLQEYLAAKYLTNKKELQYFEIFVEIYALSHDREQLLRWSIVRRFMCTIFSKSC